MVYSYTICMHYCYNLIKGLLLDLNKLLTKIDKRLEKIENAIKQEKKGSRVNQVPQLTSCRHPKMDVKALNWNTW